MDFIRVSIKKLKNRLGFWQWNLIVMQDKALDGAHWDEAGEDCKPGLSNLLISGTHIYGIKGIYLLKGKNPNAIS